MLICMARLLRKFSVMTLSLTFLVTSAVTFSVEPVVADSGISVVLISPKPGSQVNPDLPFVITLAITGGGAASANNCFDYNNLALFGDLTFGAQAVDAKNLGKQLVWGVPNSDYRRTNGPLVGWSARIIPNGIECSIEVGGRNGLANFQEGLNSEDEAWFGTKQSNWSGSTTNFGAYSYVDLAWKYKGVITHNKFQATSKGTPTVSLVGLQRGQTIDYEATFQVVGTMSSDLTLSSISASVDGSGVEKFLNCDKGSKIVQLNNGDGTTTYKTNCTFLFTDFTTNKTSLSVSPHLRWTLNVAFGQNGEIVTVNVGKQGQPACSGKNKTSEDVIAEGTRQLKTYEKAFAVTYTSLGASAIDVALPKIIETLDKEYQALKVAEMQVISCNEARDKNLLALSGIMTNLEILATKVKNFINDSAAQQAALKAKQEADAKAAAEQLALKKKMYDYGYSMVSSWSNYQLAKVSIQKFLLPGKKYLSAAYARDWCSQLPKIVIGLSNKVGFPANPNYISGCAAAAIKIKLR